MNRYTEEEIWALVDGLRWGPIYNDKITFYVDPRLYERLQGCIVTQLKWHYDDNAGTKHDCTMTVSLSEFLGYMSRANHSTPDPWSDIIFETPLEKVPLYINEYPEICAWRLEIAR